MAAHDHIKVTLPDGSVREVSRGATPADVASQIGKRLARDAVVARIDGRLVDLHVPLQDDVRLEIITADSEEGLEVLRHSAAHVMAQAVKRFYPEAKLAIGPPIENGFYYDFDVPETLSEDDLGRLEEEMARIVEADFPFQREEVGSDQAVRFFRDRDEGYKVEILQDLDDGQPSIYSQGEFVDLCRGPHVPSTGKIKAFKLLSVAGAYWRGDSDRPMLQRIYGTAFADKASLDDHLRMRAEAAKRDHRRLGRELDLFSLREEAPGFLFWHPKGFTLYRSLETFSREIQEPRGYEEVSTPWIMRSDLWKRSGHWDHYRDNMFQIETEGETMAAKPMNCPAHCLLFARETRSYRDLPVRLAEYGPLSRYEASGTLHGALRVRGMHQDDAHLFVREDQIEDEIRQVLEIVDEVYHTLGMPYVVKLSTRPDAFMGEIATWDRAEQSLAAALDSLGRDYVLNPKDGAFYGPKLDFDVRDALGRTWQCATVQLDFQLPEKFDLTYVDRDGSKQRPVMIHRAIMGTLERFVGMLVEHYGGAFPPWLAPVQATIIPVGEDFLDYGYQVRGSLVDAGLRAEVDERNEKVGYKIRAAQTQQVPYMLVVGAKEVEAGTVAVRHRRDGDLGSMPVDQFTARLQSEMDNRVQ